jgi:hypothetical protein
MKEFFVLKHQKRKFAHFDVVADVIGWKENKFNQKKAKHYETTYKNVCNV